MPTSIEKIVTFSIFLVLLIVSFFIFQPYFTSIMFALVLAYLFYPVYLFINKRLKSPNVSAFIVCIMVILVLVVSLWIMLQITVQQVVDFYTYVQTFDITAPIKAVLSKLSSAKEFSVQLSFFLDKAIGQLNSFVVNLSNDIFVNLPVLLLQAFVTFFVMFYFIRDGKEIVEYLRGLLPFKEQFKERFFVRFKEVTRGVIYGTIIVGIIQGITAGIGYYIFGVKGAFVLMLASCFLSIFPFLGPWAVYVPTSLLLMAHGNIGNGIGLLIFGIVLACHIDNLLRPYFIGKKAKISMALALVGMLGGMSLFGIIGLIIGPLILDYTLMFIDFYKAGKLSELI